MNGLNYGGQSTGKFKITIHQYDIPVEVLPILEHDKYLKLNPALGKFDGYPELTIS
jgi:hypothetical protein